MKKYLKSLKKALIVSLAMFFICGFAYPMVLTGIAQVIFPDQANGSLVEVDNKVIGSELVGQDFTDERLFHCRPSAYDYNTYTKEEAKNGEYTGPASGSNNYAPSNPELEKRINEDIEKFLEENPTISKDDIPSDIITASGSGLDPHISVDAANVQIDRVANNTGISKKKILNLIKENTEEKFLGVFGEEKVNVLKLNLFLVKELKK